MIDFDTGTMNTGGEMDYHNYVARLSDNESVKAEVVNDDTVSLIIAEEPRTNVTDCRFFMSAEMARKIAAALLVAADDVPRHASMRRD